MNLEEEINKLKKQIEGINTALDNQSKINKIHNENIKLVISALQDGADSYNIILKLLAPDKNNILIK